MLFVILDEYAKTVEDCRGWDILGIGEQQWYVYKRKNTLPLKHCRTLCLTYNAPLTDSLTELSTTILHDYNERIV